MGKWSILIISAGLVAAVDQLSKGWIAENLALGESMQPIPALAPFLQFTRIMNSGAAFGILPTAGNLFLALAFVIIAALLWQARKAPAESRFAPLATGIVIGGALGNVLDRLAQDHVVDFIHYTIPGVISNVSNVADHAIVLGALLIAVEGIWRERRNKNPISKAD